MTISDDFLRKKCLENPSIYADLCKKRPRLKNDRGRFKKMVPVAGLEPARCRQQWILSPPRLPIPTHRRVGKGYYIISCEKMQVLF